MVVKEINIKKMILPLLIGIICALSYAYLSTKLFIAMIGGISLVCMALYNVNIGIGVAIFAYPFLSNAKGMLLLALIVMIFIFDRTFLNNNRLEKSHLDVSVIIFTIMIVVATALSTNVRGSARDLSVHLVSIAFLFTMINSIKTKEDLNAILTTFVLSAGLVAAYGLFQYKTGIELDKAWVDKSVNPEITVRVYSVFGNPNILAEYLIIALPFAIALFWDSKRFLKKLVFLGCTGVLMLSLVLTTSRGGWVGFALGVVAFIILVDKRLLLGAIPVGIVAIFLMPPTIINRILSIGNLQESSNATRIKIWSITLDIIRDNWLTGVGFGYLPFKQTFVQYIRTMNVFHAHNMYFETISEMGILGLIALVVMIFVLLKYSVIAIKNSKGYLSTIGAGAVAALLSILCHGLFENVLYIPRIIMTFWVLIGFILVIYRLSIKERVGIDK